jgi:hypothetical protein
MTTDLVHIRRGTSTQVSLYDLQDRLDARAEIAETRTTTSTRKARVEQAQRVFAIDPTQTMVELEDAAAELAVTFDPSITLAEVPLSKAQIRKLSDEFIALERLKTQIEAMQGRYRELIYAHLDETVARVPGRPASQVPGKVEAEGDGPRIIFERRGGNRKDPDLDAEGLRSVLPADVVAKVYKTLHHAAVAAYDEPIFDEGAFGELVNDGTIDLDVVAPFLTPGEWRTPSFYKTLVDGAK